MGRWYLLPSETVPAGQVLAGGRRWKYAGTSGLLLGVAASGMPYGPEATYLLRAQTTIAQHAALTAQPDVYAIPADLTQAIGPGLTTLQLALAGANLAGDWITAGHTWRQAFANVAAQMQFAQRLQGRGLAGSLFAGGLSLSTRFGALPAILQLRLRNAAQSFGWREDAFDGDETLAGSLRAMADQWPPRGDPPLDLPADPIDAFTNTDGTTLPAHNANWGNNQGEFRIFANSCRPDGSVEGGARYAGNIFGDQYSEATYVAESTGVYMGVGARHAPAGTATFYLFFRAGDPFTVLGYVLAGTATYLASDASGAVGQRMRLEAQGSTLRGKWNGSIALSVTDSTIVGGNPGVAGYGTGTGTRIDDWQADSLSGAFTGADEGLFMFPTMSW